MIARTWRGTVRPGDGHRYLDIMARTGLPASRSTPGNLGFYAMQRSAGDHDEILTISLWESRESIAAFAGDDISRAVFYAEDDDYLLTRELHADHWEVVGEGAPESPRREERG